MEDQGIKVTAHGILEVSSPHGTFIFAYGARPQIYVLEDCKDTTTSFVHWELEELGFSVNHETTPPELIIPINANLWVQFDPTFDNVRISKSGEEHSKLLGTAILADPRVVAIGSQVFDKVSAVVDDIEEEGAITDFAETLANQVEA